MPITCDLKPDETNVMRTLLAQYSADLGIVQPARRFLPSSIFQRTEPAADRQAALRPVPRFNRALLQRINSCCERKILLSEPTGIVGGEGDLDAWVSQ